MIFRLTNIFVITVVCVVVATPFYHIIALDEESFSSTLISSVMHAEAIKNHGYLLWTDRLGFGIPQPFSQNLYFHPSILFFMVFAPETALFITMLAHLLIGVFSVYVLCKHLRLHSTVCLICSLTFLFSSTTINYLMTDYWPTVFVAWTLFPLFILILIRFFDAKIFKDRLFYSICCGTLAGIIFLNSHTAIAATYFISSIIFIVAYIDLIRTKYAWLFLALSICLIIASAKLYYQYSQYLYFQQDIDRTWIPFSLFTKNKIWTLFLKPVFPTWHKLDSIRDLYNLKENYDVGGRIVWFGGIFTLLAISSIFYWRKFKRSKVAFTIMMTGGLCMMHAPQKIWFNVIAWPIAFRDPIVLSAILLAGFVLNAMVSSKYIFVKILLFFTVSAHVITLVLGVLPFWLTLLDSSRDYADTGEDTIFQSIAKKNLNDCFRRSELIDTLVALNHEDPGRIYMTENIENRLGGKYKKFGLCDNSLALHRLQVVNGKFKGISYDPIYPDKKLMHGALKALSDEVFFDNPSLANVLGIKYILSDRPIRKSPFAVLKTIPIAEKEAIYVLKNNAAWQEGVVVADDALKMKLQPINQCGHTKILCTDFMPLESKLREDENLMIKRTNGNILLTFQSNDAKRTIFVSEYYRDGWKAYGFQGSDKEKLDIIPVAESFIGIHVPQGISSVQLFYQPIKRIIFEIITLSSIFISILSLILLKLKWLYKGYQ